MVQLARELIPPNTALEFSRELVIDRSTYTQE